MPGTPLVLVTGATGFVGTALCAALAAAGYPVRRALRTSESATARDVVVGEIDERTDWTRALESVGVVVHLAARTHVLEKATEPLSEYRRLNVRGTKKLVEAAADKVRRFVFLSSVKVNGEVTTGKPFQETDAPQPQDTYGITKLEAEELLTAAAQRTGLDLVILRPPLVYGPGVKGNLLRLLRLIAGGAPLPFKSIDNRRSLIGVANLADAIVACVRSPQAAGRTYLLSDAEDLSTPTLVRMLAAPMHVKPRLFRFPVGLLEGAGALMGKTGEITRLTRSLEIDSSRIRTELAWVPPQSVALGLAQTGRWYNSQICARAISK
jgi:UDP-N-acetyl-alpha-D-quinovosamine dehydrogenase